MQIKLQEISPAQARHLLENNTHNRRLRDKIVRAYADQMKAGKWLGHTGESIKIDKKDRIIDGQHRLAAIVESGKTQTMLIATDVPEEAFTVIDTGLKRGGADALEISGVKNKYNLAANIKAYLTLRKNRVPGTSDSIDLGIYNYDIIEEYNRRPIYWDKMTMKINQWYVAFNRMAKPSFIAGHYLVFREKHATTADIFFEKLITGKNLGAKSPIMQMRNILLHDYASRAKLPALIKSGLMIKAWNMHRGGQNTMKLDFDPAEENFPVPK